MHKKILLSKSKILEFFGGLYIFMIPAKPILPISLFYTLGLFCLFLVIITSKKNKLKFLLFEKCYIIFYLLCCIGVIFTKSEYAISLCFRMFLYIIGVFSSMRLLNRNEDKIKFFYNTSNWFVYGTLFISFYCLVIEGINNMRLGEIVFDGVYGTYIELSICLLISIMLVTAQLFYRKDNKLKNYIIFAVLVLFCVLSQTRKIFLGILLLLVFSALWKSNKNLKLKIKYIIIAVIFLFLFQYLINNISFFQNIKTRFNGFILYTQGKETYDNSSIIRSMMRNVSFNSFLNNPIIGNGTDSARIFIMSESGLDLYSHCNFTEILCNNGLIGFLMYYFYHFIILIKSLIYSKREKIISGILISSMLVLIFLDYWQVSYYNVEYIFIYLLLSYLYSFLIQIKKNNMELN